jgi:N-methylhydantoinase B/oxoprolinase/acetone carboxylase alpha subunit
MSGIDDPIAFELFSNSIFSIADEMALAIFRTAYSGVLKGGMDFSTAFADGDGRMVERKVSSIMARYGGVIERAIRTLRAMDDWSDEPFEIHVLKFPSRTSTMRTGMMRSVAL